MKIVSAEFVTSTCDNTGLPKPGEPQVVFVGRSNVGKSSLINALACRRIARTSRTPGKTRLINVYKLRLAQTGQGISSVHLLDLPGYGFSRGSRTQFTSFAELTDSYFGQFTVNTKFQSHSVEQHYVANVMLLIDSRHLGLASDLDALDWLHSQGCRTVVIGTKVDTLSRAQRNRADQTLEESFGTSGLFVSAKTGKGMNELWKTIIAMSIPQP